MVRACAWTLPENLPVFWPVQSCSPRGKRVETFFFFVDHHELTGAQRLTLRSIAMAAYGDRIICQAESSTIGCNETQTAFLTWFTEKGGTLDERCRFAQYEALGTGLVAAEAIEEEALLFSIPRHVPLNLRNSRLAAMCQGQEAEARPSNGKDGTNPNGKASSLTWEEVNTGWTGLILCMMWERLRSTEEGRAAWLALSSKAHDKPWFCQTDVQRPPPSSDGQDAMDTSTSSAHIQAASATTARKVMEWGPYFDVMPTTFDTPMFWKERDLRELKGTSIPDKLGREEAEAAYFQIALPFICSHAELFLIGGQADRKGDARDDQDLIARHYSLDKFHVMGSLLLSRAFHLKGPNASNEGDKDGVQGAETNENDSASNASSSDDNDEDNEEGEEDIEDVSMVPMADMLNARYGCDNARLFYKPYTLEMRATRRIEPGEQIWNTYGEPPSSDLLRRYGYVDLGNPGDIVELTADNLIDAKLEWEGKGSGQANDQERAERRQQLAARMQWACLLGMDDVVVLTSAFAPSTTPPYYPQSADASIRDLREAALGLPEDALVLARVLCWSESAFLRAQAKDKLPSPRVDAVEDDDADGGNKPCSVATLLGAAIDVRLKAYATSADEDDVLLYGSSSSSTDEGAAALSRHHQASLSRNARNAIVVRLSEKRILLDTKRVLAAVQDAVALKKRKANAAGAASSSASSTKASSAANKRSKSGPGK